MAWKIRKELKKYLLNIKFNVRKESSNWYEIIIEHPSRTIEDAKNATDLRDMLYGKMYDFEVENGVSLSITIWIKIIKRECYQWVEHYISNK